MAANQANPEFNGRLSEMAASLARAFAEECRRGRILIATTPVPRWCRANLKIDRFDLWRNGSHAVWLARNGAYAEAVRARQGTRYWARQND